jgi:hypothetical protein
MAIYRIFQAEAFEPFQAEAFEPEAIAAMAAAYEDALLALGIDRTDPLTNVVAAKIIELFKQGESDAGRLRDLSLEYLRQRGGQ